MEPILQLHGINKTFGAVQALRNVDFEVYPHEVVGLVGDNGAGKSTLIKIIAGVYTPDSGDYLVDNKKVIETVYQDLALCDNLDVVSNLFLGREETAGRTPFLNSSDMERRTLDVLRQLDVKIRSVHVPVSALSGGQRQS